MTLEIHIVFDVMPSLVLLSDRQFAPDMHIQCMYGHEVTLYAQHDKGIEQFAFYVILHLHNE